MDTNLDVKTSLNNEDAIEEAGTLEIKFCNCFDTDITIDRSGRYELKLKNELKFEEFAYFFSASKKINPQASIDIILNGFSIKNDKMVRKYLQQNCLILNDTSFLNMNLSVYDNIKTISLLFTGYDLANACLSSFGIKEMADQKVQSLSKTQQYMVILSYTVCCPSIIWVISKKLLSGLPNDEISFFENAVKIRIKHGGIVVLVDD